jgi:hypothetical protein
MNQVKRWAGWLWMLAGPALILLLLRTGLSEIQRHPVMDTRIQWGVFIIIFIPIAIGLMIFGWYAWKGYYDHLPETSTELEED